MSGTYNEAGKSYNHAGNTYNNFAGGSGQTIILGQALETDAPFAPGKLKVRSVTQALEADTAQAVARHKNRAVGQSLETDATFAVGRAKRVTTGLPTETDTALPLGAVQIIPMGQALETDTSLVATRRKTRVAGQALESDTTGRFWIETPTFTTSGTTDANGTSSTVAIPAGAKKGDIVVLGLYLLGGSSEDPTPTFPAGFQVIAHERRGGLKLWVAWKRLQSAETGNYTVTVPINQWMLTHAALVSGARPNMIPVQAANTATAAFTTATPSTSVTATQPLLLYFVSTNSAVTSTPPTGFTEALDTDYLRTSWQLPRTTGSHTASGGTTSANTDQLVALIAFSEAASSGNQWLLTPPAIVTESDSGLTATARRTRAVGQALETDAPLAMFRRKIRTTGQALETDVVLGTKEPTRVSVGQATETDSSTLSLTVVKQAWYFRPPGPERAWEGIRQPLMRRADIHRSLTVIKKDGAYSQVESPTNEQFNSADVVYLGGYTHKVSPEEATNLTNAGYGGSLRYE